VILGARAAGGLHDVITRRGLHPRMATTIQMALKCAPRQTMHVAKKCSLRPTLSQPNNKIARKPDFQKECEDTFRRQRAAKHVAHVTR